MDQERIEQEWAASKTQRDSLGDNGAQTTFASLPGFAKAFTRNPGPVAVLCIDEGCTGNGTHLAGSGCGIPEEELLDQLRAAGITEFTTHEGCGAWALAHPELPDAESKESSVIAWGDGIAAKLNVPHRHITAAEMKRPADLHNAFYAIYDATGSFNRDMVPEMGPGFVTSPNYFPSAKNNLELAVRIAFGDHGFGKKFDTGHPFVLVGIVDPADTTVSTEQILADLQEVQAKFPEGLVKTDSISLQ